MWSRKSGSYRVITSGVGLIVMVALLIGVPLPAAAKEFAPVTPQKIQPVATRKVPATPVGADPVSAAAAKTAPAPTWPSGSGEVEVAASGAAQRVGALPVYVQRATAVPAAAAADRAPVRVEVVDRAHSHRPDAVVLRIGGTAGPVTLRVDYAQFRGAYGGDWAARLRLVLLPECALSTPEAVQCQGTPVLSRNDPVHAVVTGDVDITRTANTRSAETAGTLVALEAAPGGASGDYTATSLQPSATWQTGGASGDFSWSYPLQMPPATAGVAPSVALSYSAQSVDGRTVATNNQPSWIGEGFSYSPGFVERRYRSCAEDMGGNAGNAVKTGDQCWATDNATLSLRGTATELVRDGSTGAFRPRTEDGSRIEHLIGAVNGDDNGEYWKVTTTDGTQYWFGRNRIPGWAAGRPETRSTWTAPVFGNNPGEPCHAASFDTSFCQQAYRWNLDYVVDVHGNSMSFWYTPETNFYGRNLDPHKATSYVRDGYLARIDYGTRTDAEFGTAGQRVLFEVADRCITGSCATHTAANWPDAPWDQECTGDPCNGKFSPTFWSIKRLAKVTTQVWDKAGYRDVDSWSLRHGFPDPGDGTRAGLWLAGITHTGLVGGSLSLPEVTFTGVQLNNRVDGTDHSPAMNWWRVASIRSETGGEISVRYSDRDCLPGSRMPGSPQTNTLRCFPVYWTPQGFTDPVLDWFHKYVAVAVTQTDHTGGAPRVVNTYEYLDSPAWRYDDDDGLVLPKHKTWGQWRGYARVRVRVGDPGDRQTLVETRYFRGMDGASVADDEGNTVTDDDAFSGMTRQSIVYDRDTIVSAAVYDPWESAPTATRTINGSTVYARFVNTATTRTRTALDGGRGWRRTTTTSRFDQYGLLTQTDDRGDDARSDDDRCLRIGYGRNSAAWLLVPVARIETYALPCDRNPTSEADVIADMRHSFDGKPYGAAPTTGDVTAVEASKSFAGGSATYVTVATSRYDAQGRVIDTGNALNKHSTLSYEPASGGPVTTKTVTNPLGHKTSTQFDQARGNPIASVDPNDKRTDLTYDPLGRLTGLWLPGRVKGVDRPNASYAYVVHADGASAVAATKLTPTGDTVTSYTLYDSLLRLRQSQAPSPNGGRLLTDVFYDTAGRAVRTYGTYYNGSEPSADLVAPVDPGKVPNQHHVLFDNVGRVTADVFEPAGREAWRTSTYYGGDHADITPPAGGTATSTLTDARGNKTELRQYRAATPTGAFDATTYSYDPAGRLTSVTGPDGTRWTDRYDLRGRKIESRDPDSGVTTATFDDAGRELSTTDARGTTLTTSYDDLDRRTALFNGTTKIAEWRYDLLRPPVGPPREIKGYPISSTRWDDGKPYTIAVRDYTETYQPTGTIITIPDSEGALAGSYMFKVRYAADGLTTAAVSYPTAGGLDTETVEYEYTKLGLLNRLTTSRSDTADYVKETTYTELGQLKQYKLATATGGSVYRAFDYDLGTGRLSKAITQRSAVTPNTLAETTYSYDPAGSITKIADTAADAADNQCFRQDYLQRLTEAWTPASGDCSAAPAANALGGPAPYWQSFTYDVAGNRRTRTDHRTVSDSTTRYTYDTTQPHTLVATNGATTGTYRYDPAGNTLSRPGVTANQTLAWTDDGHLSTVTEDDKTTSFRYAADGSRLIRRDGSTTTLYLPGMELRWDGTSSPPNATRYYTYGSDVIASRTATGLSWLASDPQGTQSIAINATNQQAVRRRQMPFGEDRGTGPAWPNEKGFVGGDKDPTGLTHLGAREYDPTTGRFISVDPVLDTADPQQMNGYAYSDNSPVSRSDPSGLRPTCGDDGHGCAVGEDGWVPNSNSWSSGGGNGPCSGSEHSGGCVRDDREPDSELRVIGSFGVASNAVKNRPLFAWVVQKKREEWLKTHRDLGPETDLIIFAQACTDEAYAAKIECSHEFTQDIRKQQVYLEAERENWTAKDVEGVIWLMDSVDKAAAASLMHRSRAGSVRSEGRACNSFDGDTPVRLADGEDKPIDQVKVGDQVQATDPNTGNTEAKPVTALHLNQDTELADVTVTEGNGNRAVLHTTQHHPFWDGTRHIWADAADLQPGDQLQTPHGVATVAGVRSFTGRHPMYNLTVQDIHTYYVVAGTAPGALFRTPDCPL